MIKYCIIIKTLLLKTLFYVLSWLQFCCFIFKNTPSCSFKYFEAMTCCSQKEKFIKILLAFVTLMFSLVLKKNRNSPSVVRKGVLKICCKLTGEHPCRSATKIQATKMTSTQKTNSKVFPHWLLLNLVVKSRYCRAIIICRFILKPILKELRQRF